MATAAQAARAYMARGWSPTPVRPGSKAPLLGGWPRRRLLDADLHLFAGRNVGLVLGEGGGGIVDVDCDWPEARRLAPHLLPETGLVHGRPGSPSSHFWYRCEAQSAVFAATLEDRKPVVVELRAAGSLTPLPPSTHPNGERLSWDRWGGVGRVTGAALHRAVSRLAAAALVHALGRSLQKALGFVRSPSERAIVDLENRHGASLPLRAWLRGEPHAEASRSSRSRRPMLIAGRSSPLTEAVLSGTDGVVGAARLLGLALREGRQTCPFHRDSGPRSLQVSGHVWRCWAGCGSGNAIHFVALASGLSYLDARSWLAYRLDLRCAPQRSGLRDA
jgi:hypothetical protein